MNHFTKKINQLGFHQVKIGDKLQLSEKGVNAWHSAYSNSLSIDLLKQRKYEIVNINDGGSYNRIIGSIITECSVHDVFFAQKQFQTIIYMSEFDLYLYDFAEIRSLRGYHHPLTSIFSDKSV